MLASGDLIQAMLHGIQHLMNKGRVAEARELPEQFNRATESLRVREDSQGSRQTGRLEDTGRERQGRAGKDAPGGSELCAACPAVYPSGAPQAARARARSARRRSSGCPAPASAAATAA